MRSSLTKHAPIVLALATALVISLVGAPSGLAAPPAAPPAPAAPAAPAPAPATPSPRDVADAGSAPAPVVAPPPPPSAPAPARGAAAPGGADITAALACSACHTTSGWKTQAGGGTGEGGFDHSKTGFPLTGLHTSVACVSCHLPKRPTPSRECSSCHADFHRGRLSQSCDKCHSAVGWKVTRPLEIHRMTRFPLTGMHALADCNECHLRAADHQWSGTPVQCFGCHDKEYNRPNLRPTHQGPGVMQPFSRDCSVCHRATSWVPAFIRLTATGISAGALHGDTPPPPRHDLRFPISFGPHRTATCADCHASEKVPQAVRCTGCHAHEPLTLSRIHKQPVSMLGGSCLSCHPGGARR
jgi:hypothetical protein